MDRASEVRVCESADDRRKIEWLLYEIAIAEASLMLRPEQIVAQPNR
jgi:hypothetical protein